MQVINPDYYCGSFHIFTSIREEVAKKFGEKLLEYSSKGSIEGLSFQRYQQLRLLISKEADIFKKLKNTLNASMHEHIHLL